jgi:ferritin-like metal-binding protein YciE
MEAIMSQRKTVDDLFVHMLSDIYSAEKQLTRALGKLSRNSRRHSRLTWKKREGRSSGSTRLSK